MHVRNKSETGKKQSINTSWRDKKHPLPVSYKPIISKISFIIQIQIQHLNQHFTLTALIDSGADGNFMNQATAERLHLKRYNLNNPPSLQAIDGSPIGSGQIKYCTSPMTLITSFLYQETISFMITDSTGQLIVLGTPW